CAGAMVLARIDRLVYGAADPKAGAVASVFRLIDEPRLNHRVAVTAGVLAEPCGAVLTQFFQGKRAAE
ncbi:MAG: nucleoside deaminase, partial [Planctomycetes bacterium]|nr:nucleoside deaminase [Planctomycetota bacterium]